MQIDLFYNPISRVFVILGEKIKINRYHGVWIVTFSYLFQQTLNSKLTSQNQVLRLAANQLPQHALYIIERISIHL